MKSLFKTPLLLIVMQLVVLVGFSQSYELADEYWNKAEAFKNESKNIEAAEMYLKSSEAEKLCSEPRKGDLAVELYMTGYCYDLAGQNNKAIDYYQQSLVIDQELKRDKNITITLSALASTLKKLEKYEEAIQWYSMTIDYDIDLKRYQNLVDNLLGMGDCYFKTYKYESALQSYKEALNYCKHTNDQNQNISKSNEKIRVLYDIWNKIPNLVPNMGHHGTVFSIAISPDSNYIITGGEDSNIILWSVISGQEFRTFTGHKGRVYSVAITSDGKKLVSGSASGDIKVWDIESGMEILNIKAHENQITTATISPDNTKILSGATYDKIAKVWDINSGKELNTFAGHDKQVFNGNFSPDGSKIVTIDIQTIRLWDLNSGSFIKSFFDYSGDVMSVAFSPDGKTLLSGSYKNKITLWDIDTGTIIKTFEGHSGSVNSVQFSSDGKFVLSASSDKTLKLWNIETGVLVRTYTGHSNEVVACRFFKDGEQFISADHNLICEIKLWDINYPNELRTIKGLRSYVRDLDITPDGKQIIYGNYDGYVNVWDLNTLKIEKSFVDNKKPIWCIDLSDDGKQLVTRSDNSIIVWDYLSGKQIARTQETWSNIYSIKFSPNGNNIATAEESGNIRIWNAKTGNLIWTITDHKYNVTGVNFFDNGSKLMSCATDGVLKYRDVRSNPYSNIVVVANDGQFSCMDLSTKANKVVMGVSNENMNYVSIRDITTKVELNRFKVHNGMVRSVHFSDDGKLVASGNADNSVKIWDLETNSELKTLRGHKSYISALRFTPDNKRIITASEDGTIKIWDIVSSECLLTLITSNNNSKWMIYTNDGYWDGSDNCGDLLSMVKGMESWKIDQFAINSNRPDILMKRIGLKNTELENYFEKLHKKRLRKMGIKTTDNKNEQIVPLTKIAETKIAGKFLEISFLLSSSWSALSKYNIFVNDVPIFGALGKSITGKSVKLKEDVELITGLNKVEVSCTDISGNESYRALTYVNYEGEIKGNLYLLAFGVSNYQNPSLNLQYAAKDALDLEKVIQNMNGKGFENVYTKVLTNEQVTPDAIKASKDFVKNAKPDDTFILFIAGHGMHDRDAEATYYFLTSNADINNLKGTAADFETIEDLLQGIPPRNKLFLMDACESGEIDEEDEGVMLAAATGAGIASRGFKKVAVEALETGTSRTSVPAKRTYLYQKDRYIYNDLVRRSGAIVFSSSKGGELSYERSDIENGLFTEYIMKALSTTEADNDGDGTVTTDELRHYVSAQVAKASGELQHPTVDRDNIYQKFGFGVK